MPKTVDRVLVLGLDGATWTVLDPMRKRGLMPNLDAFLAAVTGRQDRSSVRLRTITWNNAPEVITLKLDKHYWPAYELVRTPTGWDRRELE